MGTKCTHTGTSAIKQIATKLVVLYTTKQAKENEMVLLLAKIILPEIIND